MTHIATHLTNGQWVPWPSQVFKSNSAQIALLCLSPPHRSWDHCTCRSEQLTRCCPSASRVKDEIHREGMQFLPYIFNIIFSLHYTAKWNLNLHLGYVSYLKHSNDPVKGNCQTRLEGFLNAFFLSPYCLLLPTPMFCWRSLWFFFFFLTLIL